MANTSLQLNITNETSNDHYCPEENHVDLDVTKGIYTTAYVIALCVSMVGNILVVAVVFKNRNMRTVTNYFIVNLAASDLLLTVFNMPQSIYYAINYPDYTWPTGEWGTFTCKFLSFVQSVSMASSVLSLIAVAVDRYLAIVFPLKMYMTFSRAWVTIATIWLVSMAISSLFLSIMTVDLYEYGYFCVEIWDYPFDNKESPKHLTIVLFSILYLVPLVTMSILYGILISKLWIRKVPGQLSLENQQRADRSKKKVLKMLMTVVALFAICWLPVYITQFLSFFAPNVCVPGVLRFFGYFLGHVNSAINPCVYAIFNENFRRGYINILKICRCRPRFKVHPFVGGNLPADNNYGNGVIQLNGSKGKESASTPVSS